MYKNLLFFGLSKSNFKRLKLRFDLVDKTQIHHVIPIQFKNYSCLRNLNIDDGCNLMLLPNKKGASILNTTRPVHQGPHYMYNSMVRRELDKLEEKKMPQDITDFHVSKLILQLRQKIRHNQVRFNK